jgi:hypothetical protein
VDVMHARVPGRAAQDGTSVEAGKPGLAKRIACVVVIAAAAVMLGLTVNHGLLAAAADQTPAAIKAAKITDRVEECTYRTIRQELPKGAIVYVADYWHGDNVRLTDLETLWTVPEVNPAKAQWTLSVGRGQLCTRRAIKVQHR